MVKSVSLGLLKCMSAIVLISLLVSCGGGSGSGSVETEDSAKPTYAALNSNVFTNEPYDAAELSVDPATGQSIVRTRLTIYSGRQPQPNRSTGCLPALMQL